MAQQHQLEQEERAKKLQQQQQQNEERYAALEPWMMHFQLGTLPEYYYQQQQQQQQEQQQQEQQEQEQAADTGLIDASQVMIAIVYVLLLTPVHSLFLKYGAAPTLRYMHSGDSVAARAFVVLAVA
jgi:hypothetical protein